MRALFIAQLVAGIAMISIGLFYVPAIPYVLLDVVLSPADLQNRDKVGETLALLQRAQPQHQFLWIAIGLFVAGVSLVGIRKSRRPQRVPGLRRGAEELARAEVD